jgi:hypothetical protein
MPVTTRKMHQTTVRFGADLWETLEEECSTLGVSVAQFVREAALTRLMYVAGRRGDPDYSRALELSDASTPASADPGETGGPDRDDAPLAIAAAHGATGRSARELSASSALWAQGRQARRRAQELRRESERRRLRH